MQLLELVQSGDFTSAPNPASVKPVEKLEPLSMAAMPQKTAKIEDTKKTDLHLNKAANLLEELSREEKSGFSLNNKSKDSVTTKPEVKPKETHKKSAAEDNYDDDFDDIEEDLPVEYRETDKSAQNIAESG
jgi:hypothetical protein